MEEESDEDRFFKTFKSIVDSIVAEKQKIPKWNARLKKFYANVQFRFRLSENTYMLCHLIAKDGDFQLIRGPCEKYDFELGAAPEDLYNFTNHTYSTLSMIFKKNPYGQRRLQLKRGGRHLLKLMTLSKILSV